MVDDCGRDHTLRGCVGRETTEWERDADAFAVCCTWGGVGCCVIGLMWRGLDGRCMMGMLLYFGNFPQDLGKGDEGSVRMVYFASVR